LLSLIPIQRGNPHERPFFFVPGGWVARWSFSSYAQLARIGPDFPLFGLKARGADGRHTPHRDVGKMATY